MNVTKVALNFWKNRKQYPNYPHTLQRRLIDVNFVVEKLSGVKSILDLGCGEGAMLLALRGFTEIDTFYGYDISPNLIEKLLNEWGKSNGLSVEVINLITIEKLPETDVTLSMGSFSYIFKDEELHKLLRNVKSDLLIVRASCTLNKEDEVINKFSEDLGENYAAIYRTVSNYKSILSKHFIVSEISRAYPDEIESKYGTKHFFFVCKK
jgi:SAM-dependent methyltransferase